MNPFAGLTYYEILEVARGATREEITAAFQRMRSIYGPEGLATYSLFTAGERGEILAALEESFRTLTDHERRREYDLVLIEAPRPAEETTGPQPPLPFDRVTAPYVEPVAPAAPAGPFRPPADPPQEITGESLRRYREAVGLSLDRVWELTRIRKGILQAIESEDRSTLPARVYLKGLLATYARALRLAEPEATAQKYLDHLQGHLS